VRELRKDLTNTRADLAVERERRARSDERERLRVEPNDAQPAKRPGVLRRIFGG